MKKLFTFLLFISLALLTTECRVSNLEPVPQVIENGDGSKMTIFGTPKYQENVYVLDKKSSQNTIFQNNLVIIPEDAQFINTNPNGRIGVETKIKIGDKIIVGATPENPEGAKLQIDAEKGMVKITSGPLTIGVGFEFHLLTNATDIFEDFSAVFSVVLDLKIGKPLQIEGEFTPREEDKEKKKYTYETTSSLVPISIEPYVQGTCELEVKVDIVNTDVKFIGTVLRVTKAAGVKLGLEGKLKAKFEKELYKSEAHANEKIFVVLGCPIVVGFDLAASVKGELNIDGSISLKQDFFGEKITDVFTGGYNNGKTYTNSYRVDNNEKKDVKEVKLEGTATIGIEVTPSIYFYHPQFLKLSGSFYPNAEFKLTAKCEQGSGFLEASLKPKMEVGLKLVLEFFKFIKIPLDPKKPVSSQNPETNILKYPIDPEIPIVKVERELAEIDLNPERQPIPNYTPCSYTRDTPSLSNDLSLNYFKDYLQKNKFIIHTGNTPPQVVGGFESSPNVLIKELLTQDANDQFTQKTYGKTLNSINSTLKTLVLIQYDKDKPQTEISSETATSILEFTGNFVDGTFTIFAKTNGNYANSSNTFSNYVAITGKLTSNGIGNFQYAFYRIKNVEAYKIDIPIGGIRIFKDNDIGGLASKK